MFMNEGKKIEVEQKKTIKGVTSKSQHSSDILRDT